MTDETRDEVTQKRDELFARAIKLLEGRNGPMDVESQSVWQASVEILLREVGRLGSVPDGTTVLLSCRRRIWVHKRIGCSSMNDLWGSAGGMCKPSETVMATAMREVREEAGLVVSNNRFEYGGCEPSEVPGGRQLVHYYRVRLRDDEIPVRMEPQKHSEWWLVPASDLRELPFLTGYSTNTASALINAIQLEQ